MGEAELLAAHCYRMLGSLHDAEDALQESLLGAWGGLAGFEGRSSVRTWLYRISTNACLRSGAQRARRVLSPDHGPPRSDTADLGEPVIGPVWLEPWPDDVPAEEPARPAPAGAHADVAHERQVAVVDHQDRARDLAGVLRHRPQPGVEARVVEVLAHELRQVPVIGRMRSAKASTSAACTASSSAPTRNARSSMPAGGARSASPPSRSMRMRSNAATVESRRRSAARGRRAAARRQDVVVGLDDRPGAALVGLRVADDRAVLFDRPRVPAEVEALLTPDRAKRVV